ncbi:MAG: hypothetical protein ACI4WU_04830 [Bacilli bacterium]
MLQKQKYQMDVLTRSYVKKLASGISNISSTGDTINFTCRDGTTFSVKVSSGVINIDWIEADKILKVYLADGSTKEIDLSALSGTETKEIEVITASSTWNIQHNLNAAWNQLFVNIIDSDNNIVYGDIDIDNSTDNLLVVKFNTPISGKIIIKK